MNLTVVWTMWFHDTMNLSDTAQFRRFTRFFILDAEWRDAMGKTVRSRPDFFGGYNHYDEHGKKVGSSSPSLLGGYKTYDEHGKESGHSSPSLLGGYNHYDKHGKEDGYSVPSIFGGYNLYDKNGDWIGFSDPDPFDPKTKGACYIATCVYGSYDCPEVWTLRRYRDLRLRTTVFGRWFIRLYYAVSPVLVRAFGQTRLFRAVWKTFLDKQILRLNKAGYENTPYADTGH